MGELYKYEKLFIKINKWTDLGNFWRVELTDITMTLLLTLKTYKENAST